ncbi:MAG: YadA-like family protein [Geobacteraceae bacterium]|nr:YadA-like family protein [Geobacteraceae bacterium]
MKREKIAVIFGMLMFSVILAPANSRADQVIADDLIVQGSTCVGFDCVDNESFGFDTIRLKENNLRIKFEDTSSSAGFPSTDWEIIINDSASGGQNYFGVNNVTTGMPVLRIFSSDSGGSVLMGEGATTGGTASVAIGRNATSTGNNSVAIGAGSNDGGESNVVSVGTTGNERRITNVAAGVNPTDAVNMSQIQNLSMNALSEANAYTDRRISNLSREAHRGIAGAIAMSRAMVPLSPGESGIAMGFGTSSGQTAVAVSLQHFTSNNIHLNLASSYTSGNIQVGGGIGYKFGR